MKKLLVLIALLTACFGVKADTVTMQLAGLGGVTQGGYYVGPATGTANGTPITMVCDDFSHHVSVGQTWTATISTFTDLSNTRFVGQVDALAKYKQAAWLFDQFSLTPSATGDIQFAIWSLFTPATPVSSGALSWLSAAQNQDLTNYNFSGFRVFTPTVGGTSSPQEFIGKISGAEVPEPASLFLLGSGLAGVATLMRKRNGKKKSADK